MDRLSALIAALALLACEESKSTSGEPSVGRVDGAKTPQKKTQSVESFCDVYSPPDKAKPLAWPALAEAAPKAAAGWRWINIWATWCKPCVEEMPRLVKWKDKLKNDLVFVSVDESADDIATFKQAHADAPPSLRLADSKTQEAWFSQLGLQGAPPIPIHVFVDAQQRVRCVRAGGVREQDYAVIEKLLSQ